MNRERTRTLLLTWRNYPCCKRLSVRVCSCSIFPPSPWVQLCTAADNTVSPLPASWVNRLLSVNRACLWHSSLLHTIWFQGKFSPSVHAHCFWCSKEGIARFCPSEILPSCWELQALSGAATLSFFFYSMCIHSFIWQIFPSAICQVLCSFLGNIWLHENLWDMTSKHFHSYEESSAHEKRTIQ